MPTLLPPQYKPHHCLMGKIGNENFSDKTIIVSEINFQPAPDMLA